jgi:hypothetical protein
MCSDRFATATFANDSQNLAAPNSEVNTFHRADHALVEWK